MSTTQITYRVLRQDIDVPGGFAYLGRFSAEPNLSPSEAIATAKRMYPHIASPVVEPGRR